MASDDTSRSSITRTHDTRPAPGAMNAALGRTSEDLATDQPAGLGPDPILGTDIDQFSGETTVGDDSEATTRRKFNPDIPPDERLGLRPTIKGDAAPNTPVDKDLYGA